MLQAVLSGSGNVAMVLVLLLAWAGCGGTGGAGDAAGTDAAVDAPEEGRPCDDGNPCTYDDRFVHGQCTGTPYDCLKVQLPFCVVPKCDGMGGCIPGDVIQGYCFVDGACYPEGTSAPEDDCQVCKPQASPYSLSPAKDGKQCSDSDKCTAYDECVDGQCKGTPISCDDENPCTIDHCESDVGCVHEPWEGVCDDGDPCTVGDHCEDGKCVPGVDALECEDQDPCTVDTCVSGQGCENVFDPEEACDDQNPCTLDSCDKGSGCAHEPVEGDCDDGDACTLGDHCVEGKCVSGSDVPDCDDNSPCTNDWCSPEVGCVHQVVKGECDDGEPCTIEDTCLGGQCVGKKTEACPWCSYPSNTNAAKINMFQIGTSGTSGEGLDLDGNPDTCAPAGSCSGGVDNELGLLAPFLNPSLAEAAEHGTAMYLVEFQGYEGEGKTFTVNFLGAHLSQSDLLCDFQNEECTYTPFWASLTVDCEPVVSLDNAIVENGKLEAGGKGYTFGFHVDLTGGGVMEIAIMDARIEATVDLIGEPPNLVSITGLLGGAVNKAELMDAVSNLSEEVFPVDKQQVLGLLDNLIENDLDTDGDGVKDAASVALRFNAIPADIAPQ